MCSFHRSAWAREARRLNLDPPHVFQVRRLALMLFDALPQECFVPRDRDLLEAAALLHDIGLNQGASRHHKRSRDWILALDLPGLDPTERAMVACIARYHRKAHPNPSHRIYSGLASTDRARVMRLAAVLRVADGLDRGHDTAVRDLHLHQRNAHWRLCVVQRRESVVDIQGAVRKRKLFEHVFGVKLAVESAPRNGVASSVKA